MARSIKAIVKPELLVWARTRAGFSQSAVIESLKLKPGQLEAWEDGDDAPTITQLDKLAKKYGFPVAIFYLAEPPKDFAPLRDFRRLPGEVAGLLTPKLTQEIRLAQERRQLALDLMQLIDVAPQLFPISATLNDDPEELAVKLRRILKISLDTQAAWTDGYQAYNGWRSAVEEAGGLVFQISRIGLREARGFAIASSTLPVVAVNAKDHPHARIFSLMHELAHVALGQSGISDWSDATAEQARPPEEQKIEVFCNRTAAAVLMPKEAFLAQPCASSLRPTPW